MEPTQPNNNPESTNQPPIAPEPIPAETQAPQSELQMPPQPYMPQPGTPQPEISPQATDPMATPTVDPATPQVMVSSVEPSGMPMSGSVAMGGPSKKKWVLPAIIVVVVLVLLGGGYVFGLYLPNQPDAVYSKGLSNSGKAIDKLIDYSQTQQKKDYKSYGLDGTMSVKTDEGSGDGTISGAFNSDGTGHVSVSADILSEKFDANVTTAKAENSTTPDLYVQISGVKQELDAFGLSSLDSLDGKWISIDHTLVDSYLRSSGLDSFTGTTTNNQSSTLPTAAQLNDVAVKVQDVNKDYLFTTDSSKAVLTKNDFVGKETKDGRETYHYKVGYNKANLQAYVAALKTAIDSSTLNDWSKSANNGKDLSAVLDWDSLTSDIKTMKTSDTFDLWVDKGTKLIQEISLKDPTDGSTVTIAQNYTGGDTYPFTFGFAGTDGEKGTLGVTIDTKTNKVTGTVSDNFDASDSFDLKLAVTPSATAAKVTTPTGAIPLTTVLAQLGLGSTTSSDLSGTSLLGL